MIGALSMMAGVVLFGASVIRTKYYPGWIGIALVVLMPGSLPVEGMGLAGFIQSVLNVRLASVLISIRVNALTSQEWRIRFGSLGKGTVPSYPLR